MSGPLDGIHVLDLTHVLNGPYATMLLGHMGADVIKVEFGSGDRFRHAWMPVDRDHDGYEFAVVNANKRFVTLNLKAPEGQGLLKRFVERSDVVVSNFSNETTRKLGLTYDQLSLINPRVIVATSSGYGMDGPHADVPALAPTIRAVAGWTHAAWAAAGVEGTRDLGIGDEAAGVSLALGICAALVERDRSGQGQAIDVSMQEAQLGFLVQSLHSHFEGQTVGTEPVACADGYFALHMPDLRDEAWRHLATALGHPEAATDEQFATLTARRRNFAALNATLREWMGSRTRAEVWEICTAGSVPGAPVLSLGEVLEDRHLQARESVVKVAPPNDDRELVMLAPWIRFSRTPSALRHAGGRVGAHNGEVYSDVLGLSESEIADLVSRGAI